LERRRAAFEVWDEKAENVLHEEVSDSLADAKAQFAEVADDLDYWTRVDHALETVFFPRYLKLAKAEHSRELSGYGIWRQGDFLSRIAYGAAGLLGALIIWKSPIPDWLEPFPIVLLIVGPLIPDMQLSKAKRNYDRQMSQLIEDMRAENSDGKTYRPLGVDAVSGEAGLPDVREKEKS